VRGGFVRLDGFKTASAKSEVANESGPSAVTVGRASCTSEIRASSEVCPVDLTSLEIGTASRSRRRRRSGLRGVDEGGLGHHAETNRSPSSMRRAPGLKPKAVVSWARDRGYAVDEGRGLFFTNLETRTARWSST